MLIASCAGCNKDVHDHSFEISYTKKIFRDGYNHSAWARYIPTIPERIKRQEFWLTQFTERDNTQAIAQTNNILALLNKLA